jgi:hypothetical protein
MLPMAGEPWLRLPAAASMTLPKLTGQLLLPAPLGLHQPHSRPALLPAHPGRPWPGRMMRMRTSQRKQRLLESGWVAVIMEVSTAGWGSPVALSWLGATVASMDVAVPRVSSQRDWPRECCVSCSQSLALSEPCSHLLMLWELLRLLGLQPLAWNIRIQSPDILPPRRASCGQLAREQPVIWGRKLEVQCLSGWTVI